MTEEIQTYLGVDWGEKRIGLAIADSQTKIAIPLKTVANFSELLETIKEEEVDKIVLGAPVKMSGEKKYHDNWQKFSDNLQKHSGLDVILQDERLSSLAADALSGQKKDKAKRDELAAAIILQHYLDKN